MNNIAHVMPAAPWVALYKRTSPSAPTSERNKLHPVQVPLIGWALVESPSLSGSGRDMDQRLVGMVVGPDGRGVELVDESTDGFERYSLPFPEEGEPQMAFGV